MAHPKTTTTPATRRQCVQTLASLAALGALPTAWAQGSGWPTKPISVVVPFPAGGGTDAFARPLSGVYTKVMGKSFVIDNRGGAGGTLGASVAAKAPADGYNFFMGGVHHAIAPSMYPKLDYNLERDFVPVILLATVPQVLVVNTKKFENVDFKALLAQIRSNPGKLNYASAGSGTSHHLAGELFKLQTKTFITHIPYRGAGPALTDLISGNVDMLFDGLGSSAQHIKAGRIKALMVAGNKRNPAFPNVPCAAELGLPEYTVSTWYGLWAPKGTPDEAVNGLVDAVKKASQTDDFKTAWAANGAEFPGLTQAAFGQFVAGEIRRWASVVKASGAKLE